MDIFAIGMLLITSRCVLQADQLTEEQIAGKTSLHCFATFLISCECPALWIHAPLAVDLYFFPFKAFHEAAYRS